MRAVKYGVTRDYVRSLRVVMPNGEILTLGATVAKNSSGYSLKDLVIGSEGTLCVICEAVLKLVPLPKVSVSLLVPFKDMKSAIESVPKIILSKVIPTAIEYMSRDTILFSENYLGKKFPDTKHDAYILLTFDGNSDAQVQNDMNTVADLCLEYGHRERLCHKVIRSAFESIELILFLSLGRKHYDRYVAGRKVLFQAGA